MFLLPVVFFCNTILFALIFQERFKVLVTYGVYLTAFIISLCVDNFVYLIYPNQDGYLNSTVAANLFILVIASIFASSNNLAQKILVAITIYYSFVACNLKFTGLLESGQTYYSTAIYVLIALIIAAIFTGPMRYFYRRSVDLVSIGFCALAFAGSIFTEGYLYGFINADIPIIENFFLTIPVIMIMICVRSSYSIAKQKESDTKSEDLQIVQNILIDNFNAMLLNINAIKRLKNVDDFSNDPLLEQYCDNPNLNAVVATKVAYLKSLGVDVKLNIAVAAKSEKVLDLCSIASHLMDIGTNAVAGAEKKNVYLSVQEHEGGINFELLYDEEKIKLKKAYKLTSEQLVDFLKVVLVENVLKRPIVKDDIKYNLLKDIVFENKGKMNVSYSREQSRIKISI